MWWSKRSRFLADLSKLIIAASVGSDTAHQHDLELLKGQLAGIDPLVGRRELFALRVAVSVLVAQEWIHARAQADMRKAMAKTFHALLTEATTEHVADWLIPAMQIVQLQLANGDPNLFIDYINERATRYAVAYAEPNNLSNPLWGVGELFSELCGAFSDIRVITVGSIEFSGSLQMALHTLRQCQGLPGGEIINIDPDWKSPFDW